MRVTTGDWFAHLYRSGYRDLVLVAYALTRDLGAAEDIAQEAFAVAYGRRARVELADSREEWVRAIAVRLARRRTRRDVLLDRLPRRGAATEPEPDPHAAIHALDHDDRTAVVLHHLADLSVHTVASIVDVPVGTVLSRLALARTALAHHLRTEELPEPDVEAHLTSLRAELLDTLPVPPVDRVTARHGQRRATRRTRIGAVAAVLVVGAVVPMLRQPDQPSAATPPPTTTLPALLSPATYTDVQFFDDDHGYALRATCDPDEGVNRPPSCALALLATTDREHWRVVGPIPVPDRDDINTFGWLVVLGPDQLAIDHGIVSDNTTSQSARIYSADGGRTWRDVPMPPVVTETVPAIPRGANLLPACSGALADQLCTTPTFTVVRPGSGTSAVLANPPPLSNPTPGPIPTPAGHWWAVGKSPETREWAIALSRDDGRTWTTSALGAELPGELAVSVTANDGTLWAAASGREPAGNFGLCAILRSDDDGRTWRRTWQPDKPPDRDDYFMSTLVAAADGTLSLHDFSATYRFTDGGRTLEMDSRQRLGMVRWTKAGYVSTGTGSIELSTDGLTWRALDLPN
ncbi:sigma factor-like helix-turn-helix DNA-binding protein [Actinophytocola sediminis]